MPLCYATLSQAFLIVAASSVGASAGAGARTGEEEGTVPVGGGEAN